MFAMYRCPLWWGGVVFFWYVTAFNWLDYSIDQSNCRTTVACQNKFTTPPTSTDVLRSQDSTMSNVKFYDILWHIVLFQNIKEDLCRTTFRDLVVSGKQITVALINALMERYFGDSNLTDALSARWIHFKLNCAPNPNWLLFSMVT